MTKYNGATWGSCCIQATNLLYQKNSQTAIDANNTWFYIDEDEEKNREITSGWRYPSWYQLHNQKNLINLMRFARIFLLL